MNKTNIKILEKDYTYITDCWKKFVELTPDEINNLRQMAKHQKAVIARSANDETIQPIYGLPRRSKNDVDLLAMTKKH